MHKSALCLSSIPPLPFFPDLYHGILQHILCCIQPMAISTLRIRVQYRLEDYIQISPPDLVDSDHMLISLFLQK